MNILATIKELSETYRVPIKLISDPTGLIKLYINYELVNYITVNDYISEDYTCDRIRECVERHFKEVN